MKKLLIHSLLLVVLMCGTFMGYAQKKYGGIALYTVRSSMEENPQKTLEEVADLGFKNVEAAGYNDGKFYGMTPAEYKETLKGMGLVPVSSHMAMVTLENADQLIADVKAAGMKFFVVPIPPMGMFTFDPETRQMGMKGTMEEFANILTTLGQKCNEAGIQLLYHNHDFEYKENEDGIVPIEYLLENTDPEFVNFQMDLYWVTRAGADPLEYFEKYPGRFLSWHVKDMDDQQRFAPVGTGSVDFARVLAEKKQSGMEYYFVEQDMTFDGMEPMEALGISHENLKKIGFK